MVVHSTIFIAMIVCALAEIENLANPPTFEGLPSIDELVSAAGLKCTHILVTTEDGYLMWMHRIGNSSGPPVLLQHGVLNAADLWINRGPEQDLAFLLSRQGYDVYLGNQRGNAFSQHHVKYKKSDPRFWDFSFHESGHYDMPAMINKILKLRGLKQLYYVGYSLGTTVFFTMASLRPEYNTKIKLAVLLAPVANPPSLAELSVRPLKLIIQNYMQIVKALASRNVVELFPRSTSTIKMTQRMCSIGSPMLEVCLDIIANAFGEHRTNLDLETLGYQLSFSPAGTSIKTMIHLGQVYNSEKFSLLDYGPEKNLLKYNSTEAPAYNLTKITAPVALFWGNNDCLISRSGVKKTASQLGNLILEQEIKDPLFSHADVIIGKNAKEVLYLDVIDLLNKIEKN